MTKQSDKTIVLFKYVSWFSFTHAYHVEGWNLFILPFIQLQDRDTEHSIFLSVTASSGACNQTSSILLFYVFFYVWRL